MIYDEEDLKRWRRCIACAALLSTFLSDEDEEEEDESDDDDDDTCFGEDQFSGDQFKD